MKKATVILVVAVAFFVSARGQEFLNLDFESAYNLTTNVGYGVLVPVTNALPDWTAYGGYVALSDLDYASNVISGSSATVGLDGGSLALNGNFSAVLYDDGSISQTGLVPTNAESLEFEAHGVNSSGPSGLLVTLGGQSLSFSALSQGSDYTVYDANIPASMDGQSEALSFAANFPTPGILLDDIQFLNTPEPSECVLIGLGAIVLGFYQRRKRQR